MMFWKIGCARLLSFLKRKDCMDIIDEHIERESAQFSV